MSRKILLQVTTPAVGIGLLLFAACAVSAWYIQRLQTNLAQVLSTNVASQEAAQELEIEVRRLRFHSFLHLVDPSPERRAPIDRDHEQFEAALQSARQSATTPEEKQCVEAVEAGYRRYRGEIDQLLAAGARDASRAELARLADAHPVQHVVAPAQELLRVNKEMMERTREESRRVARQAYLIMILLGLIGPAAGILTGYGVARALSRSIYRLGVRVHDMASRLDQDVASVSIEAEGGIRGLDRQLEHVVRRVEEVTERQQLHQREMLRAEQLAAVGQLAAGVAHEVRNPLTSVKLLVEVALRSENRKPLTLDDLRVIHREVDRLEQTAQGLLDFARPPAPHRSACDLRGLVTQAAALIQARARQQRVEIDLHLPEHEVVENVDPGQFRTVLINLFLNALDAMPQGGRLEVRMEASPVTGVKVRVLDSGAGIAPEVERCLFTPFVSTKPTGTGLGLSISHRIVEEHGGKLIASNRPEGGACFEIALPATGARGANSHGIQAAGTPAGIEPGGVGKHRV
jgi:signal transduction histidine kinase